MRSPSETAAMAFVDAIPAWGAEWRGAPRPSVVETRR